MTSEFHLSNIFTSPEYHAKNIMDPPPWQAPETKPKDNMDPLEWLIAVTLCLCPVLIVFFAVELLADANLVNLAVDCIIGLFIMAFAVFFHFGVAGLAYADEDEP